MARRWQLAALVAALAVAAAGGAGYLLTRPHTTTTRTATATAAPPRPRPTALVAPPDTAPVPADVPGALRRPAHAAAFGGALTGIVVDAVTGRILYARHADRPVPPASTVKLLTAVAALDALKPTATLATTVRRSGRTLYVVGGGDMTLAAGASPGYPATATLRALARRTAAALPPGRVRLRYDATAWTGPGLAPGWKPGYFTAGDVSRLSPLEVDEARLRPSLAQRDPDPAASAAAELATELRRAGVPVARAVRAATAPAAAATVAVVRSAPVAALVQHLLTVSDNDLAESLGRAVAAHDGLPATFAGEATAILRRVAAAGLPDRGVRLEDASGLSRLDRVTPRLLVAAVRLAQHRPDLRPVVEGLPVAGATGTLVARFRRRAAVAAAGVTRAKTGTLAGVSGLVGQTVDASGRLLDFAFLTDAAGPPISAEAALDDVATAVAACGCR